VDADVLTEGLAAGLGGLAVEALGDDVGVDAHGLVARGVAGSAGAVAAHELHVGAIVDAAVGEVVAVVDAALVGEVRVLDPSTTFANEGLAALGAGGVGVGAPNEALFAGLAGLGGQGAVGAGVAVAVAVTITGGLGGGVAGLAAAGAAVVVIGIVATKGVAGIAEALVAVDVVVAPVLAGVVVVLTTRVRSEERRVGEEWGLWVVWGR